MAGDGGEKVKQKGENEKCRYVITNELHITGIKKCTLVILFSSLL
jgi:hypothetical protein